MLTKTMKLVSVAALLLTAMLWNYAPWRCGSWSG